jgi:sugar lactone lactonase YvrE
MLACIAWGGRAGRWIAGMESGIFEVQTEGAALQTKLLAPVAHASQNMRFNDGRCDRQGRMWAGTMPMNMGLASKDGALYRYDAAGLHKVIDGLITSNGLGFSPDGRVMYLSDSHPTVQSIWAFDYDTDSGTPSNRRLFVDMNAYPGRPDGAAVDADGCYWICGNDAGLIHRFTPAGKLDRSLAVPVKKPAMCAFGGAGLDTLFVTSIRPGGDVDLSDQPLAGSVFALRPGVRGLPEPAFV